MAEDTPLVARIRAGRERRATAIQCAKDAAEQVAADYADALRDDLRAYVDIGRDTLRGTLPGLQDDLRAYVDDQIAALCTANDLIPPP